MAEKKSDKKVALNLEDGVNRLNLYLQGELTPDDHRTYTGRSDVALYLQYLTFVALDDNVVIDKDAKLDLFSKNSKTHVTIKKGNEEKKIKFSTFQKTFTVANKNTFDGSSTLTETELFEATKEILDSISEDREVDLESRIVAFLMENKKLEPLLQAVVRKGNQDLVKELGVLPKLPLVWSRQKDEKVEWEDFPKQKELKYFLEEVKKDKRFNSAFAINRVFAVLEHPTKKPKGFKHQRMVLHGTQNHSMVSIVNTGFKLGKVRSGRSLGHGVYFGQVYEPSRPAAFMDNSPGLPGNYFLICRIHFDEFEQTRRWEANKGYDGRNMLWAKELGRWGLDELVVLPEQVEILFVAEVNLDHPENKWF